MAKFKLGDKTKEIWAGDLISECEYIADLGHGQMLFYDVTFKLFRLVFWEQNEDGKLHMNGWLAARSPSEFLTFHSLNKETKWRCRRCKADVIDKRCKCKESPSPWEPV